MQRPVEPKQYTSRDFAALARANGVILSVSGKGECWDNAVAESFFATIKRELIDHRPWPTRAGLHRAVFDYIEGWSRYAGDPLRGREGPGGRDCRINRRPWWGSRHACFVSRGQVVVT